MVHKVSMELNCLTWLDLFKSFSMGVWNFFHYLAISRLTDAFQWINFHTKFKPLGYHVITLRHSWSIIIKTHAHNILLMSTHISFHTAIHWRHHKNCSPLISLRSLIQQKVINKIFQFCVLNTTFTYFHIHHVKLFFRWKWSKKKIRVEL